MILCGVVLAILLVLWISFRKIVPKFVVHMLGVLATMAFLGLLLGFYELQNPVLLDENRIRRNENGDGDVHNELRIKAEGLLDDFPYVIEVLEQALLPEEEGKYLKKARQEIEEEFLGENESFDCIRNKVRIRDTYGEGRVKAEWSFDNYKVIDFEGNVQSDGVPEDGELVEATVKLSCGEQVLEYSFYFRVYPHIMDERERFFWELKQKLQGEMDKKGVEYITLPQKVMDYTIQWREKKEYLSEKVLLLGGILAVLIPLSERSRERDRRRKRAQWLSLEYPNMVSKLVLLLGSGMTMSGAWKRITKVYIHKRKEHMIPVLPVYEEMLITQHEMESGMGEERAYQRFGERCGQMRYRRLGNILAQNLRKGTRGLRGRLEMEVENAFEERKRIAKKLGEEAGTKLLLPMMIMFGIVMMILIVPAVLSFSI